jgi:hypothetical protein
MPTPGYFLYQWHRTRREAAYATTPKNMASHIPGKKGRIASLIKKEKSHASRTIRGLSTGVYRAQTLIEPRRLIVSLSGPVRSQSYRRGVGGAL